MTGDPGIEMSWKENSWRDILFQAWILNRKLLIYGSIFKKSEEEEANQQ